MYTKILYDKHVLYDILLSYIKLLIYSSISNDILSIASHHYDNTLSGAVSNTIINNDWNSIIILIILLSIGSIIIIILKYISYNSNISKIEYILYGILSGSLVNYILPL